MGREVKRVPVGFDWPIGKVWEGYVNPHYRKCPDCDGGYSRAYKWLEREAVALLKRMADPKAPPGCRELYAGLATDGRREGIRPADFDNPWSAWFTASRAIGRAAGVPTERADRKYSDPYEPDWRTCGVCEGSGLDPAVKAAYEAWERYDPPAGDGWQMWSTTTEGHPMTPAFDTPEELARYCDDHAVSVFGRQTQGYNTWLAFITGGGWAPSAVVDRTGIHSGVAAVAAGRLADG